MRRSDELWKELRYELLDDIVIGNGRTHQERNNHIKNCIWIMEMLKDAIEVDRRLAFDDGYTSPKLDDIPF